MSQVLKNVELRKIELSHGDIKKIAAADKSLTYDIVRDVFRGTNNKPESIARVLDAYGKFKKERDKKLGKLKGLVKKYAGKP